MFYNLVINLNNKKVVGVINEATKTIRLLSATDFTIILDYFEDNVINLFL